MRSIKSHRLAAALALCGGLSFIQVVIAADNQGTVRADSAGRQAAASSPNNPTSDDGSQAQQGALGVTLGEAAEGVAVVAVVPRSPAVAAGLRVGDQIRRIDDFRVTSNSEFIELIRESRRGDQVEMVVQRNRDTWVIKAKLTSVGRVFGTSGGTPTAVRRDRAFTISSIAAQQGDGVAPGSARLRAIQQEMNTLQQQIQDLKNAQPSGGVDINDWFGRHQRGEDGGDPAVLQ